MSNGLGLICMWLFILFTSTKTEKNVNDTCATFINCKTCINDHKCQFVVWKSNEKKVSKRKCVDITLNKDDVSALGPLGNDKNDSHWDMYNFHNETKCYTHHAKEAHKIFKTIGMYIFCMNSFTI
jgi:hypothetical protein